MKLTIYLILLITTFPLVSCFLLRQVDISKAIEAREKVPPPPSLPLVPRATRIPADKLANTEPVVHAPEKGLIEAGHVVAVVSGTSQSQTAQAKETVRKGVILDAIQIAGPGDWVNKFVGDALYYAIRKHGISIVDRDYRVLREREDPSKPETAILEPAEALARTSWDRPLDFFIVVHASPLPRSNGGISQVSVPINWEVLDNEWSRYQKDLHEYLTKVDDYNTQVREYEKKCRQIAEKNKVRNPLLVSRSSRTTDESYIEVFSQRIMRQVEVDWGGQTVPTPIDTTKQGLITDPSQILPPEAQRSFTVSAFRFDISVRVIDAKSGEAAWFAFVGAQDLSITTLVSKCTEAIVTALIARRQPQEQEQE